MPEIGNDLREALRGASLTHQTVAFTDRIDPHLWDQIRKMMRALGGRYQDKKSAFVFDYDPCPVVRDIITTRRWMHPRTDDGYVPTPEVTAEEIVVPPYADLGRMPPGSRILEPSAGDGALVRAILDENPDVHIVALEPNPVRFKRLTEAFGDRAEVLPLTFEQYAAGEGEDTKFDGVIMNPPFAVPGQPKLWIDHVLLAWRMLEPGARLVSIVYGSLAFGRDRRTRDLREMVKQYGGWHKLDPGTFPTETCVLWAARPIPGQEGQPPWLFRHYPDTIEPVPVREPWLTARAVVEAPVQVWQDPFDGRRERVLRYRAQCWGCGYLLWQFDGDNDQALGNHATIECLDPDEYGMVGLSVGLCPSCHHTSETWHAAKKVAEQEWRKPPTKRAAVSLWEQIISRGGLLPVSDIERQRHARVNSVFRTAYGLPDYASDEELTEARKAQPIKGGIDRQAVVYLTEYAARLDPNADLDDLDRWALMWRPDPDAPAVPIPEEDVTGWADTLVELGVQMELFDVPA